jgi:hypothetical protein
MELPKFSLGPAVSEQQKKDERGLVSVQVTKKLENKLIIPA